MNRILTVIIDIQKLHFEYVNNGGKDSIILQDRRIADYQIVDHNGNRSYLPSYGLCGILIEDYEQQNVVIKIAIRQGKTLNNEQLDGLINFMAAFDYKEENGSIDLITCLSTFDVNADFNIEKTI